MSGISEELTPEQDARQEELERYSARVFKAGAKKKCKTEIDMRIYTYHMIHQSMGIFRNLVGHDIASDIVSDLLDPDAWR